MWVWCFADPEPIFGASICCTAEVLLKKLKHGGKSAEYRPGHFHLIVCSPPCVAFSVANTMDQAGEPRKTQLAEARGTVIACLDLIKYFKPISWWMENPVGLLAKQDFMQAYSGGFPSFART
jgi:site-specific DNA-cytosine methylase